MLVVTSAIANLIRENKTFRITSAIQTGAKHGMQLVGRLAVQPVEGRQVARRKTCWSRPESPDDLARRIANAERGIFDDEDDVNRKAMDGKGPQAGRRARAAAEQ